MLLALALTACGDSPPPAPAPGPAAGAAPVASAPDAPAAAAPGETVEQLLARANAALAADRLFEPAGDNALELYLAAIEQDEADTADVDAADKPARRLSDAMTFGDLVTQTRLAVSDILPYGLVWVERAIRNDSRPEAERVLTLLERAQPGASSLQRLRDQLNEANNAAVRAVAQAEAAATAAAAAAAEARAAPTPAPEPAATTAPAAVPAATTAAPAPAAATPAARPAATPVQPTAAPPAPTRPAAAPAASLPAGASPQLISQPSLRYPAQALRRSIEGYVQVSFTIQPDGSTTNVEVTGASPRGVFDREAVRVIEGLKFQPPGRAIQTQRQVDFKLDQ